MRLIDADKLKKSVLDLPNCYNGFSDTYDKACIIGVIDEQPTIQSQWIPVSERLPEECVRVIISYHTQLAYRFVTEAIRRTDDTYYAYAYDCVIGGEKVDAWMPLPNVYKVTE